MSPDIKIFNEDVFKDLKIEKYLKQLGEISFMHLLLGNTDGILGNFNPEKFIIDENKNLKPIYTTISIINVYLMLETGILDIKEGEDYVKQNSLEFIGIALKERRQILVRELKKLINISIEEFEETGEVSFVKKFIKQGSGFSFDNGK